MPNDGPSGFRKLTPSLLQADRAAERFDGLPDGVEYHGELLAAFKAAAPYLGLSVRLVHALDWLFRFTRPQDWEDGVRPIVWPSASMQQEAFGLSKTAVVSINRGLIDAGLITMQDSPNGKRYGRRDHRGQITEAYGFDLSPIATRHAQFVRLAAEAKAERELIGQMRRRATIARKAIAQILETVAEYGFGGDEWSRLRDETQALIKALRRAERPEEITIGVGSLERRQTEARARLEHLLEVANSEPKGPENNTHNIPTKPANYHKDDTVMAPQGEMASGPAAPDPGAEPGQAGTEEAGQGGNQRSNPQQDRTDDGATMRLSIDELTKLAPRLRTYLKSPRPTWPDIIEAADWLRGEMGVTRSSWGEACIAMGRAQAAVAIAIVSAKPAAHFRSTPGGYFHGMVMKAKTGDLNLARTVWGLRQAVDRGGKRPSQRPAS
jgi:replication initiation protein RepC